MKNATAVLTAMLVLVAVSAFAGVQSTPISDSEKERPAGDIQFNSVLTPLPPWKSGGIRQRHMPKPLPFYSYWY